MQILLRVLAAILLIADIYLGVIVVISGNYSAWNVSVFFVALLVSVLLFRIRIV